MSNRARFTILSISFCAMSVAARPAGPIGLDPSWSELMSSMETMHRAMASVEPSGDSDVDFVRLMLPHHQAAIDMARTQLLHGKDPQMNRLAQEIITDQKSEITLMRLWLQRHDASSPGVPHHPSRRKEHSR